MRIVTWNLNSIRARLDHLDDVLTRVEPDVLALQETRCTDAQFPWELFAQHGYEVAHHGTNHRNGVALASRVGLDDVRRGFGGRGGQRFDDARSISAFCGGLRVRSVYVPNGRTLDDPEYERKLAWLAQLRREVKAELAAGESVVVAGDFNVAPRDLDIYDPSRFRRTTHASAPERAAIASLVKLGLIDVTGGDAAVSYTWWSHSAQQHERDRGLRIDLLFVDRTLAPLVTRHEVDRVTRAKHRASDHAPVIVDLDVPDGHSVCSTAPGGTRRRSSPSSE